MEGGGIQVRIVLAGDAARLATLGSETFRDSFAEFSPPDDTAAYRAASFGPGVQAAELAEASSLFLIAQIDAERWDTLDSAWELRQGLRSGRGRLRSFASTRERSGSAAASVRRSCERA